MAELVSYGAASSTFPCGSMCMARVAIDCSSFLIIWPCHSKQVMRNLLVIGAIPSWQQKSSLFSTTTCQSHICIEPSSGTERIKFEWNANLKCVKQILLTHLYMHRYVDIYNHIQAFSIFILTSTISKTHLVFFLLIYFSSYS